MSDALNSESILQVLGLSGKPLSKLAVLESVDSTNEWCLQQCREGSVLPFACVTDHQTKGRGRRGRQWHSVPGSSITMSIAWKFKEPSKELGLLSLAIGMAIANVLRANNIEGVMLKWPNDVLVHQHKIAGVLIETIKVNGLLNVVIGVGLNYDMQSAASVLKGIGDTDFSWTDFRLSADGECRVDRNQLTGELLKECVNMCERYFRDYDSLPVEFDSRYNAFLDLPVSVLLGNGEVIEGIAKGTTEQGELRVLVGEKERVFNSAEISLRKSVEC